LSYSISDNVSWLWVTPTNGSSTGEHDTITVNYSTSSYSAGTYNGTITISAPGASNTPQIIPVTLTVNPPSTPPQPPLTDPANYSVFKNVSPSIGLDWDGVSPVTSYQVYVSTNAGLGDPKAIDETVAVSPTYYDLSTALANNVWYWSVDAENSGQYSGVLGNIRTFILDTPLGAPPITHPTGSPVYTEGGSDTFTWSPPSGGTTNRYNGRLVSGSDINVGSSLIGDPANGVEQIGASYVIDFNSGIGTFTFGVRAMKQMPAVPGYDQGTYESAIGWGPYDTVTFTVQAATPTYTLSIQSSPDTGASISVTPPDNGGQSSGSTNFARVYNQGTNIALTAPASLNNALFVRWLRDGTQHSTSRDCTIMMTQNRTMVAVYVNPLGGISGTVRDQSTGNPIQGAMVSVSETGWISADWTDSNGYYLIDGLRAGHTYTVRASGGEAGAYLPSSSPGIFVNPGVMTENVDFDLEPEQPVGYGPKDTPVLLVRGMGEPSDWLEGDWQVNKGENEWRYWLELHSRLQGQELDFSQVWDCNEGLTESNLVIDGAAGVSANAVSLQGYVVQKLDSVYRSQGLQLPTEVNIVAHSMGGLIVRDFVRRVRHSQSLGSVAIGKVIVIATPNAGSKLADVAFSLFLSRDDSTRDVRASYVRSEFALLHPWFRSIPLYLLGSGTDTVPPYNPEYDFWRTGNPLDDVQFGWHWIKRISTLDDERNDCLVTYHSAFGEYQHNEDAMNGVFSNCFANTDAAIRDWAPLDHDKVRCEPSVVDWVSDILLEQYSTYGERKKALPYQVNAAKSPSEKDGGPTTYGQPIECESTTITALTHFESSIPLDELEEALFVLVSESPVDALHLRDPMGQVIDEDAAAADPEIDYIEAFDSGTSSCLFVIRNPEPGDWVVVCDCGTTETQLHMTVYGKTALLLTPEMDTRASFASSVRVSALLGTLSGETFEGIAGATVTVQVRKPDDTTASIVLFDDGLHDDGAADDGQYANVFDETDQAGEHRVTFRAEGTTSTGFAFRRMADEVLAVGAEIERILDIVGDELVDSDADGIADYLQVGCLVTVGTAGTYSIAGTLESLETSETVSASALADGLPEGETNVYLFFDLREHDGTGNRLGGSLSLSNLSLYSEDDRAHWLSTYEGVYVTSERYMLIHQTTGDGSVSRAPDEIFYDAGTSVDLTASASPHHHFIGWTGDVNPGQENNTSITVVVDSNKNLTAHFEVDQHNLSIVATNGSVQRVPDQVSYDYGSTVSLSPIPDTGYHFSSWAGDVPPGHETDSPLELVMDDDKSLDASFARSKGTVVITADPPTAPWSFLDGNGSLHSGTGSWTENDVPTGEIALTWGELEGYQHPSHPAPQALAKDGAVSFNATYGEVVLFVMQPQEQQHYIGEDALFEVETVGGLGSLYYEWKFNDGLKSVIGVGENTPVLMISPVGFGDAGAYWCEITDEVPWTYYSSTATLEVAEHLSITQHPQHETKDVGEPHTFNVQTSGGFQPLGYQWKKDGFAVSEATEHQYTISSLSEADSGAFWVVVDDANSDVLQSDIAILTVAGMGMPLVGVMGIGLLAGALVLAGALTLGGRK